MKLDPFSPQIWPKEKRATNPTLFATPCFSHRVPSASEVPIPLPPRKKTFPSEGWPPAETAVGPWTRPAASAQTNP